MTKLELAFAEATKLPPKEQDRLAEWLLAELDSERRWNQLFAESEDVLEKLAAEAFDEHRRGQTQELDPEKI
jgi:hypothetical protein